MSDDMNIRIGTRESKLATWQAEKIAGLLQDNGLANQLIFIKSEGDINLTTPLYEVGVQGIFTKALDIALLDNRIDIAVHSYKDVPTKLAEGLKVAAVLKRDDPADVMVCRNAFLQQEILHVQNKTAAQKIFLNIATSSIRRKAQWLHHFPYTAVDNIRGNVISRIQKLKSSQWHGAIFAAAGLQRLQLTEKETGPQIRLQWMVPAPAQGAMAIICRQDDMQMINACAALNDNDTALCTQAERDFLRYLLGGCATPIAALASITGDELTMNCDVTSPDGIQKITCTVTGNKNNVGLLAQKAATEIVQKGADKILHR